MDEEMKERIERMARRTWDAIGDDVLTNLEEMNKKPVMSKDGVIEVVCDADYMKMYGGDEEAYEVWKKLKSYKEKINAVKGAFPYKRYGW